MRCKQNSTEMKIRFEAIGSENHQQISLKIWIFELADLVPYNRQDQ